jgi:hypothetical protein
MSFCLGLTCKYSLFQFPSLKSVATRIVEVFLLFSVGDHASTPELELECDAEKSVRHVHEVQVVGTGQRLTSTRYQ